MGIHPPGPFDHFRLVREMATARRYAQWRRRYPVSSLILIVFERVKLPIGFLLFCCVIYAIANEPATH
jgi:hypothetical protein